MKSKKKIGKAMRKMHQKMAPDKPFNDFMNEDMTVLRDKTLDSVATTKKYTEWLKGNI